MPINLQPDVKCLWIDRCRKNSIISGAELQSPWRFLSLAATHGGLDSLDDGSYKAAVL